jgi:uncharacterized protein YegL
MKITNFFKSKSAVDPPSSPQGNPNPVVNEREEVALPARESPQGKAEEALEPINSEEVTQAVLVLDNSGSMHSEIPTLQDSLQNLRDDLVKDRLMNKSVELAVVDFTDSTPTVIAEFSRPDRMRVPKLKSHLMSPIHGSILKAFDLIERRRAQFARNATDTKSSIVVLLTDGVSSDDELRLETLRQIAYYHSRPSRSERIKLFCFGIDTVSKGFLQTLAKTKVHGIDRDKIRRVFDWLFESLRSISQSQLDEEVKLPNPKDFDAFTA